MTEANPASAAPLLPPAANAAGSLNDRRHEPGDENYHTILITAGILVAGGVVIFLAAWWLIVAFERRERDEKRGQFPLAVEESQLPIDDRLRQIPPSQPLLEGLNQSEGQPTEVRPSPQERLQTYGPTEPPEKGHVRVPIDVAMRHILEKGRLPVQKGKKP